MRIVVVGASGYGNVGDDTYPIVLQEQLPDHELLFFNSTRPERFPDDVSLVVLGGGGLIFQSDQPYLRAHLSYMTWYLDEAKQRGIPWGFVSCGLQLTRLNGAYDLRPLDDWAPLLAAASFITVRSRTCARLINELIGQDKARFFPDLAYLFQPECQKTTSTEKLLGLIPAGGVTPTNETIRSLIDPFLAVGFDMYVMNMGAPADGRIHIERAADVYPAAERIPWARPHDAFRRIRQSSYVVTGRYHGMVFAQTSGIPFFRSMRAQYKLVEEDIFVDRTTAAGHITTLCDAIAEFS